MKELLTTLDGVKLYDTNTCWVIREVVKYGEPEELKLLDNVFDLYKDKGYLFFSTQESAIRYMSKIIKESSMLEFSKPIPVIVDGNKEGYAIYVTDGGTWENDLFTVVHCDGGIVRHYRSDQIRIHNNLTFDIIKKTSNADITNL